MKKNAILWMFGVALSAMTCLSACSDDDEGGNGGVDNGALVSDQVPDTPGWSGSTDNGVCTYTPQGVDYQDYPGYYAFDFKDGVCQEAVYDLVCESEMEAQYISNVLNNGTFEVTQLELLLHSGEWAVLPDNATLPPRSFLAAWTTPEEPLHVWLALAGFREQGNNVLRTDTPADAPETASSVIFSI